MLSLIKTILCILVARPQANYVAQRFEGKRFSLHSSPLRRFNPVIAANPFLRHASQSANSYHQSKSSLVTRALNMPEPSSVDAINQALGLAPGGSSGSFPVAAFLALTSFGLLAVNILFEDQLPTIKKTKEMAEQRKQMFEQQQLAEEEAARQAAIEAEALSRNETVAESKTKEEDGKYNGLIQNSRSWMSISTICIASIIGLFACAFSVVGRDAAATTGTKPLLARCT
eukprot:gnl/MRDRNA2_/MRDRNA2_101826_c0_seq1.p1 gnl/MRDRNA2_/MRDRNA2_101826_c0~~gnl/MRDRNA2_/MRDRNA2_101826_c0_seq1.p1  ORF type:complete len:229 (+),score=38.14 gnl/MRDRNA2_/MRDRNA2_101826_c0_seq1:123-809(+)